MINAKAQKLIDELKKVWKDNGNKWSDAYENRLMDLTTDEVELLFSVWRESDDASRIISDWKSCY